MSNQQLDPNVDRFLSLSFEFAVKLSEESERGSILIGCSEVEIYLSGLIISSFPKANKSYVNRLMKYPGPLSSFSSQIEMAYAFRLIGDGLYVSIDTLRKIRNSAAHSSSVFSLEQVKDELDKIYAFEDEYPAMIHDIAKSYMMSWKLNNLKQKAAEQKLLEKFDIEKLWHSWLQEEETKKSLDNQLLTWKLYFGLASLCIHIESQEKLIANYLTIHGTWLDVFDRLRK